LIIFGDFDLRFLNFGGDRQGVEKRNLRGVHSGGSGGDDDIQVRDHTDFSGGLNFVGFDDGF